jgi:hypothetical protein
VLLICGTENVRGAQRAGGGFMDRPVIFKWKSRFGDAVGHKPNEAEYAAREFDTSIKICGKLCPYCGKAGAVLYETTQRIIYECSNQHQYETKKG